MARFIVPAPDDAELEIEVWKQALALQQHINDILFRLRSFFFLFLAAAATFGSKCSFNGVLDFPSNLVLLTPAVAVYLLDRFYYHLLLVGAVEAARRVEAKRPVLRLSETLRHSNLSSTLFLFIRRGRQKVTLFYGLPITGAVFLLAHASAGSPAKRLAAATVFAFVLLEWWQGRAEHKRFNPDVR